MTNRLGLGRGVGYRLRGCGTEVDAYRPPSKSGSLDRRIRNMASIEKYLMPDRDAEIALARSAAPEAISGDAKILVLGWRGYETADEGKNGFVCMVERSWTSPFNSAEFWNPRIRVPSASIRQPRNPFCLSRSSGRTWF